MQNRSLNKYLTDSFLISTIKTIIVGISTIILLPLVIQKIGFDNFGLISLVVLFGGAHALFDFGLTKTATLLIGKEKNLGQRNSIFSDILFATFLVCVVLGLALYLLIKLDFEIYGSTDAPGINRIVVLSYLYLISVLFTGIISATLEVWYLISWVYVAQAVVSLLTNVLLLLFSSLDFLFFAPVIGQLFGLLLLMFILFYKTKMQLVIPRVTKVVSIFRVALKFLVANAAASVVLPANKYMIITLTGDPVYIGMFEVSHRIVNVARGLLNSISQPLYGIVANMGSDEFTKISKITIRLSFIIFGAYVVGNLLFSLVGEKIVKYIDQDYEELYDLVRILLKFVVFSAVAEPFYRLLMGLSKLRTLALLSWLTVLINAIIYSLAHDNSAFDTIIMSYAYSVGLSSFITIVVTSLILRKGE